jgi:hypothetical protein
MLFLVIVAPLLAAVMFFKRGAQYECTLKCEFGESFWWTLANRTNAMLDAMGVPGAMVAPEESGFRWVLGDESGVLEVHVRGGGGAVTMGYDVTAPFLIETAMLQAWAQLGYALQP